MDRLSPEFIYYHQATPRGMYGQNVFQILQKRGVATEEEFRYGMEEHPSDEVYKSAHSRRLSGFSRIHTIDWVKHALVENGPVFIALPLYNNGPAFWKSDQANQPHEFHAVAIEGYDTNGFFFRNSWGLEWGNNGCGYLPFSDWNIVIKAWTRLSRKKEGHPLSVCDNARRTSAAGTVVPLTKAAAIETIAPWYVRLLQCVKGYIIKPK